MPRSALTAQPEAPDQGPVPLDVGARQIVELAAALADEHEHATARRVILRVVSQVLCEGCDALTQDGNLHLRGSRVGVMAPVLGDDL